jgi:hypothetical protein
LQQIRKGVQSAVTAPLAARPGSTPIRTPANAQQGFAMPAPSTQIVSVEHLIRVMREALEAVEESHESHTRLLDRIDAELSSSIAIVPQLEAELSEASQRYQFFQELRCYIQDMLACLDEKVACVCVSVSVSVSVSVCVCMCVYLCICVYVCVCWCEAEPFDSSAYGCMKFCRQSQTVLLTKPGDPCDRGPRAPRARPDEGVR